MFRVRSERFLKPDLKNLGTYWKSEIISTQKNVQKSDFVNPFTLNGILITNW